MDGKFNFGESGFVENVQTLPGTKITSRKVTEMVGKHALREQSARYNIVSGAKNANLRRNNRLLWSYLLIESISYTGPTPLAVMWASKATRLHLV